MIAAAITSLIFCLILLLVIFLTNVRDKVIALIFFPSVAIYLILLLVLNAV